jgi:hypothetical protein
MMKTKDDAAHIPTREQAEPDAWAQLPTERRYFQAQALANPNYALRPSDATCVQPATAHVGMSLEDLVRAEPIRASEPIPDTVLSLLRPDDALYTRSGGDPHIEVTTHISRTR